ncbi:MAG: cystathionine gamma-synthase family protein [Bacteroidales bacterium]|nr:cystathionine gamma-synthase family protein [Bacteroidales bacterium]MCB9013931.1 cystathionine gamma-synthase family protein [Bacteroidales bacterium]
MEPKKFSPETLMMSHGYKPSLSEGAIKCPIFQTSTFVFKTAEEGKAFFEIAYGLRDQGPSEELGLIYSRLNNPDLEILENRLCLWDKADDCTVFESGMSAISTVMLEFLRPGDLLLFSSPVYGGTDHFIRHIIPSFGIKILGFPAGRPKEEIQNILENSGMAENLAMVYMETPANPTNALIDIAGCKEIAEKYSTIGRKVPVVVDNTYMGPLWSHPLDHGADLVVYSATKYIGGHSDLIAGACLGPRELMKRVRTLRTFLGNMASPYTGWLLMRSLETLKIRMEAQAKGAEKVANFLVKHPRVEKVYYLGFLTPENDPWQYSILKKQYSSNGAMIAFDIKGGEKEAFEFLNKLKLFKLAVSLGSTESLAQHPFTMTHSDMSPEDKAMFGVSEKLVRLSIGIENPDDLIWAIGEALGN